MADGDRHVYFVAKVVKLSSPDRVTKAPLHAVRRRRVSRRRPRCSPNILWNSDPLTSHRRR